MRVVLDTSVICADFHFRSVDWTILWDSLGKAVTTILVPAVVLDEVGTKHHEMLDEVISAEQKHDRDYARVAGQSHRPRVKRSDVDRLNIQYQHWLSRRFEQEGCKVLPYPKVDHRDVVRRELHRKKPFAARGAGYRDYLIWLSVLDAIQDDPTPIAFVSHNTRDFADGDGLHSDLVDDLKRKKIAESQVTFFSSVSRFVEAHVVPTLESPQQIQRAIAVGDFGGFDLRGWAKGEEDTLFAADDLAIVSLGTGPDGFHARYQSPPDLMQVSPEEIRLLNSGDILVLASLRVRAEISISSSDHDFEWYPEVRQFWNTSSGHVWMEDEAEAEVKFSLVLDGKTHEVTTSEAISMKGTVTSLEFSHHRTQALLDESGKSLGGR